MGKRTSFFLQHTCNYALEGVKSVLATLGSEYLIDVVAETKLLPFNSSVLIIDIDVDFFILCLENNANAEIEMLSFIVETLSSHFPKAKIIFLTELNNIGKLKDYLLGVNSVCAILDDAITLVDMRLRLTEILK